MKKRKMFLATLLLIVMLLQCVLPIVRVNAQSEFDVAIKTSNEMYYALKDELRKNEINAYYDYNGRIIYAKKSDLAKITVLDLSNKKIDDLTGISNFTNLEELDLTANELTNESNLEELSKLANLKELNISSNEIEDISVITNAKQINNFDFTNQQITKTEIIELNVDEEAVKETVKTVDLPKILLEDGGSIKKDWINLDIEQDTFAHVDWSSFNPSIASCNLVVGVKTLAGYTPYKGMYKLVFEVKDSRSTLNKTKIVLNYVIIDSTETAAWFKDENFYKAVKNQLTKGQTENKNLDSYGFEGTTLYKKAYDEEMILILDKEIVESKISTFILNDKKIKDLTGLEKFVGIDRKLMLSNNSIESIEKIIELEENKKAIQEKLKNDISLIINGTEEKPGLKELRKNIKECEDKNKELDKKLDEIAKKLKDLPGKENTTQEQLDRLSDEQLKITEEKVKNQTKLENEQKLLHVRLMKLLNRYKNSYILTSIIPLDVMELDEEILYNMDTKTAKATFERITKEISNLEKDNSLTEKEKTSIITLYSIPTQKEVMIKDADGNEKLTTLPIEFPITEYFESYNQLAEEHTDIEYKVNIEVLRYLNEALVHTNYCTILKMLEIDAGKEVTPECKFQEGLARTKEFYTSIEFDPTIINNIINRTAIAEQVLDVVLPHDCEAFQNTTDNDYQLAGHFTNVSQEKIDRFVVIPKLEILLIKSNVLRSLEGIEALEGLKSLDVYQNDLRAIDNVDWSKLTKLTKLLIGDNGLVDIEPLQAIKTLKHLDVSNNLLSEKFNFTLRNLKDLRYANFSGNQYTDISYLETQYQFDMMNFDSLMDYFRANDMTILFHNQEISIDLVLPKKGNYTTIRLPLIFRQAEDLDNTRTSFGVNSLNGTVTTNGEEVVLYTPNVGKYTAEVVIDGFNGKGEREEGIAFGTTCKIYYEMIEIPEIELPEVNPENPEVNPENPEVNPENPEVNPENPEVNPENPEVNPENPEVNPENPEVNPENPEVNPENPEVNPETPEVNPETPKLGYETSEESLLIKKPVTSVAQFKETAVTEDGYNVQVLNDNRELVLDNELLKTGYVVVLEKDGKETIYDIAVKGDVNCDGRINAFDTGIVREYINDTRDLVGAVKKAGDVNGDAKIDSRDSSQILKYRAGRLNSFGD